MSMSFPAVGMQETQEIMPHRKFQGHTGWVTGITRLPDGQRIMTCSVDSSLRMWNLDTGQQIVDDWRDGNWMVNAMALSPDGRKVVSGSEDGAVRLWNVDTGRIITKCTGHTSYITSVCWNRDGGRVVSGSKDGTARVWDIGTGKTVLTIETRFSKVEAITYLPDTTMIATAGNSRQGGFLKIWDAKTGALITVLKGHTETVKCLTWTAGTLISGSDDDSIRIWNTTTWEEINVLTGHTGAVCAIAISPDSRVLASTSWDKTARLWNLENGKLIALPLQHPDFVICVSFSTDGKLIATGCWDHTAYSWDISGILEEAGLLNPIDGQKLLLDADATRRVGQLHENNHRLPLNFFDDSPQHLDPSRRPIPPSSERQQNVAVNLSSHRRQLLGRISSLFLRNHNNTHDTLPRPHFLRSVRDFFFRSPREQNDQGIQLQEPHITVVDVPCTKGKPRNISAAEIRLKKEKAKRAKKASTGNPRPPQSSVAQQSGEGAQAQPSSEPHADASASSTTPVITGTTSAVMSTLLPDAIIPRVGRWTRFWLFIGCVPAQYTDGQ